MNLQSRELLEMDAHMHARAAYLGDQTAVCRILGGLPCYVDTRDDALAPWLMLDGYWESWITLELGRLIQPGTVFYDVGANVGYYSLLAAGVGATVTAVEPQPRLAACLRRSARVAGFSDRLTVVEAACVGQHNPRDPKPVAIHVLPHDLGGASLYKRAGAEEIFVRPVTVDSLASDQAHRVDVIKIDAEGAEREIWRGMRETIASNPRLIVAMEFNGSRYEDPYEFIDEIREAGFSLQTIEPQGVVPVGYDELAQTSREVMLLLRR